MSTTPENRNQGVDPQEQLRRQMEMVRQSTAQEIEQKQQQNPAELKALKQQVLTAVKEGISTAAKNLIQSYVESKRKPNEQKPEEQQKQENQQKRNVLGQISRFFTALAKDIFTEQDIPEKERQFLKKLADKMQDSPDALYIQPIIERVLNEPGFLQIADGDQHRTAFEREFDNLKNLHPEAATKFKDALGSAAENGQLGSTSKTQIERRFAFAPARPETPPAAPEPEPPKQNQEQAAKPKAEKKKGSKDKLSAEELRERETMYNQILLRWQQEGQDASLNNLALRAATLNKDLEEVRRITMDELKDATPRFMELHERWLRQGRKERMGLDEINHLQNLWGQVDHRMQGASGIERNQISKELKTAIRENDAEGIARIMAPERWNMSQAQEFLEEQSKSVRIEESERVALEAFGMVPYDFAELSPDYQLARKDVFFKEWKLTDDAKKRMINTMYENMGKLFKNVSPTSLVGFEELNDPVYFSRVRRIIQDMIMDMTRPSELLRTLTKMGTDQDYIQFVHKMVEESNNEYELRKHYHEIKVRMFTTQIEAKHMADYAKKFPASMREQLLRGFDSNLIDLAIAEFERYIQKRIADNGNMIPTDLFASTFDDVNRLSPKDLVAIRANFTQRIREMQKDPRMKQLADENKQIAEFMEVQQWQIDRALSLGAGFSMSDSARMEEILATATKRKPGDFSGQLNIAQYFSVVHKWRIGRGRDVESGAGWKTSELFNLLVDMDADSKSLIAQLKNKWIPREWYDKADVGARRGLDEIFEDLDKTLTKKVKVGSTSEMTFHEALKTFNRLGMYSVAGWRIAGFNGWVTNELKTIFEDKQKGILADEKLNDEERSRLKEWLGNNQQYKDGVKYDWLRRNVGVGSCWLSDGGRAENDAKELLFRTIYHEIPHFHPDHNSTKTYVQQATEQLGATEVDRIYKNYGKRDSEDSEERVLNVHGHKMTVTEYIDERKRVYRGMNFQGLLERSPYDFMLNISQLEPNLAEIYSISGANAPKSSLTAYEYYFSDEFTKFMNPAELKARREWRAHVLRRWADGEYNLKDDTIDRMWSQDDNVKQLEKIAHTWHQIHYEHAGEGGKLNATASKDHMFRILSTASEKVKLKNEYKMTKEDLEGIEGAKNYAAIFLEKGGLIDRLSEISGKMEDKFGGLDVDVGTKDLQKHLTNMGSRKFFYTMAYRWYEVDERDILPNTNEMKQVPVFRDMSKAGEETFVRLWNDVDKISGVADKLLELDNILLDASTSGKMDKIYDIHKTIQAAEGTLGIEVSQKWNYILATVVTRFFQEDYRARLPWPLGAIPTFNVRNKSLSTIHGGYNAMTWKEEDIRKYAHHLMSEGWLGEKGKWSKEMLEKGLGAGGKKYFLMQAFPSLMAIGAVTILANVVSSAFSEELGGKK